MRRAQFLTPDFFRPRWLVCSALLSVVIAMGLRDPSSGEPPATTRSTATGDHSLRLDPASVVGVSQCVDCHPSEVAAWRRSDHAQKAFEYLRDPGSDALNYGKRMGIAPRDLARTSICVDCHGTPALDGFGHRTVITAVSCESCHNASGGPEGWLNAHAVYGPNGTRRSQETAEHRAARHARCHQLHRTDDLYQLARRCYQCHLVGNERLVNEAGHHDGGSFELVAKMQGQVRHNFHMNRHVNAQASTLWTDSQWHGAGRTAADRMRLAFVVGQLAKLEVCLRNLSRATMADGEYADGLVERIEETYLVLEDDILKSVGGEMPVIQAALETVKPAVEMLQDDGFDPDRADVYAAAADRIAVAGPKFVREHDGRRLTKLDALKLVPQGPFMDAYSP